MNTHLVSLYDCKDRVHCSDMWSIQFIVTCHREYADTVTPIEKVTQINPYI